MGTPSKAKPSAQRDKLLKEHRRLMEKERKIREAYGPLILRWGREFSGLIAFPAPPDVDDNDIAERLDGLLGKDQWAIDRARWNNAISIIVPKSNPRYAMARMLCDGFQPRQMTNEKAHVARQRLGPAYPRRFPWESEQEAMTHHTAYTQFRNTNPTTKVVSRL